MKRAVAFSFLLACCGLLLGDSTAPLSRKPAPLLEELVRLTKAGSSDATALAYAKAHRLELPPEVSDDDLLWLRESGVSETVVRYMTAIDIRASDAGRQEDVAYDSQEATPYPRAAYSHADSTYDGYPDNDYDTYPASDYGGYYPFYGGGYYPYPVYFLVNDHGFFRRFHGGGHRFGGHRGFDGGRGFRGHRGGVVGHGGSRDSWRERGFGGRRGGSIVVGPRGSGRPAFPRGNFAAGSRGPRGGAIGRGGFGHPGLSSGGHTGGGFGRGTIGHSGGGRRAIGPPGRGRR
jgi:hypothetical protein